MELTLTSRLKKAWNAFTNNRDPTHVEYRNMGMGYVYRPDRVRFSRGNEKSIVTSVYNRVSMDVSKITIKHCRVDKDGRYVEDIKSGLNDCLSIEANIDQTGRSFIQDVVMSMFDEGAVAIVPVDTSFDPIKSSSYDILTMRTGKILEWYPAHVKVRVYNDRTGRKEDIVLPKRSVAIVENPLYAVINEPNSTMQRLVRKLNILDAIDEQSGSGKLDLIIQLPYVIKSEARQQQAEKRRKDIEDQLKGPYGIAYTDGTEKITQLNRPIENNLMKQIEYLTNQLYSQIGMTPSVLDGTADEKQMINYYNRTVEPIVSAIVDAMKRSFLTKTARTQGQTIMFFRDHFDLMSVNDIAGTADAFTRNEILSSNEIRQILGMKPSDDPKADQLVNSNMPQPADPAMELPTEEVPVEEATAEMPAEEVPVEETPIKESSATQVPENTTSTAAEIPLGDTPISDLTGKTSSDKTSKVQSSKEGSSGEVSREEPLDDMPMSDLIGKAPTKKAPKEQASKEEPLGEMPMSNLTGDTAKDPSNKEESFGDIPIAMLTRKRKKG